MYTYENDFAAFVAARNEGELCEVDEEMYYYWLEVLPPVRMPAHNVPMRGGLFLKSCAFLFAEGQELCTAFWESDDPSGKPHWYAKQTAVLNHC